MNLVFFERRWIRSLSWMKMRKSSRFFCEHQFANKDQHVRHQPGVEIG